MGHYIKKIFGKEYKVNCSFYTEDEIKDMVYLSGFKIIKKIQDRYLLEKI